MRLPWQRRDPSEIDPNRRHDFRVKGGLGQTTVVLGGLANIAGPGAVERTRMCSVCGRPRDDEVHAAESD